MHSFGRKFMMTLCVLALSACAGDQPAPMKDTQIKAAPKVVSKPTVVPKPLPKANSVLGENPAAVFKILGEPRLIRREIKTYIMQYESSACLFDIVFHAANTDSDYQAKYLSARNDSGEKMDNDTCFHDLLLAKGFKK